MRQEMRLIKKFVDGERAYTDVKEVSNFHRIQASTGFRKAAEHVCNSMKAAGFDSTVHSYAFDEKKWYWTCKSFLEWNCDGAWCDVVYPTNFRLADFKANNIAVIQKSFPCDYSNTPVDVVMLDKGSDESNYEGLDLKGKIIFVRDAFNPYMEWALKKRGAIGFITDFMREVPGVRNRYDLFDIKNYTSFWWRDTTKEPNAFGFVLTPREGEEFAKICRQVAAEHAADPSKPAYPQVTCKVDSSLYPGAVEVVDTFLPGETDEEILIVAHLCHPRASANDNASGVGASMEVLRVLKQLIEDGKIAPLKRGVRVINIPEFTGMYTYLAGRENELDKIIAGFNLDMVGGRQDKGYGPLTITAQPHGAPSLVTDVAALCMDEVKKDSPSHNQQVFVPMFNGLVSDFSAGSDHYIMSDPVIDIPTPMLGQWPDINYHTSGDTIDKVDPYMLHKSASIAAMYVYTLANLKAEDLPVIFNKSSERFVQDITFLIDRAMEEKWDVQYTYEKLDHVLGFHMYNCRDAKRFFPADEYEQNIKPSVEAHVARLKDHVRLLWKSFLATRGLESYTPVYAEKDPQYDYVPVRHFMGPIVHLDDYAIESEEKMAALKAYMDKNYKKVGSAHTFEAFVQYYMDGKRTVNQIANEAILESGNGDVEMVHDFVQLLKTFGIVEIA